MHVSILTLSGAGKQGAGRVSAIPEGGTVAHEHGVPASELSEEDLLRELAHLHETRHETFLHGSDDALGTHNRRTLELEAEYVRRYPGREVDPDRLREGARHR
jgi:hypothetical protein